MFKKLLFSAVAVFLAAVFASPVRSTVIWSPAGELYPRSIADPHRSGFAVVLGHYLDQEIPNAGNTLLTIRLGGSYGILRFQPEGSADRSCQLDIGANFLGQFDLDRSLDNIGWDGLYHLTFTWTDGGGTAFKFGTFHDSSHVGDEYAERTGRRRLAYTREEAVLGGSWSFPRGWRVYSELGRAYHRSNKALMDPWRAQAGVEYESPERFWSGTTAWYAALDSTFYQENDWRGNVSVQAGVVLPQEKTGRRYRFGIEYYRGRSVIGEFFLIDEAVISAGFWWDL